MNERAKELTVLVMSLASCVVMIGWLAYHLIDGFMPPIA